MSCNYPLLVIRYLLSFICYLPCYWSSVIYYLLLVIRYLLSIIRYKLSVICYLKKNPKWVQASVSERVFQMSCNYLLLVIRYLLSVIHYPLSVISYPLSAVICYLKKKNSQVSPSESKRAWVSEWACVPNVMHNTPKIGSLNLMSIEVVRYSPGQMVPRWMPL